MEGSEIIAGILKYYSGAGFCLLGASSAWYSAAVFGIGSASIASCTETFQDARTFIPSSRYNESECEAPLSVSLPNCNLFGEFS